VGVGKEEEGIDSRKGKFQHQPLEETSRTDSGEISPEFWRCGQGEDCAGGRVTGREDGERGGTGIVNFCGGRG
jgi:hypothetical protein